jgi:hypothetical protein
MNIIIRILKTIVWNLSALSRDNQYLMDLTECLRVKEFPLNTHKLVMTHAPWRPYKNRLGKKPLRLVTVIPDINISVRVGNVGYLIS